MQLHSNHTSRATIILTCLILPYTALQNKHVLTYSGFIPGVDLCCTCKIKVSTNSFVALMAAEIPPTIGCLVLDVRCAERSTHSAGDLQRYQSVQQHTTLNPIPYLSITPEKRWSLTLTLSFPHLPRSSIVWLYQNVIESKLIRTTTIPISMTSRFQKYHTSYTGFRLDFLLPSSGQHQIASPVDR